MLYSMMKESTIRGIKKNVYKSACSDIIYQEIFASLQLHLPEQNDVEV